MTYREMMMESGGNLDWCKPLSFLNGRLVVAVCEGKIVGIELDGKDISVNDETINEAARAANEDYELYEGYDDTHILMQGEHKECDCSDCPWFGVCDAMDEEC